MRKFASPINSSPLPIDDITVSLPQIPIPIAESPAEPTPIPAGDSIITSLLCFHPYREGPEIDVDLNGEFQWYEIVIMVDGSDLTSATDTSTGFMLPSYPPTDVVWSYVWSNEAWSGPDVMASSGFCNIIKVSDVALDGAYTITASIGTSTKSIILNITA